MARLVIGRDFKLLPLRHAFHWLGRNSLQDQFIGDVNHHTDTAQNERATNGHTKRLAPRGNDTAAELVRLGRHFGIRYRSPDGRLLPPGWSFNTNPFSRHQFAYLLF